MPVGLEHWVSGTIAGDAATAPEWVLIRYPLASNRPTFQGVQPLEGPTERRLGCLSIPGHPQTGRKTR